MSWTEEMSEEERAWVGRIMDQAFEGKEFVDGNESKRKRNRRKRARKARRG